MFWPLLYPGCCDQSSPMVFIRCVHGNRAIRLQVISPRLPYSPPWFSSQLAHLKCNIPCSISHKAKQARLKSNIPRSVSHEPKQARFNRGNLRSGDFFFLAGEILFFSPVKKKKNRLIAGYNRGYYMAARRYETSLPVLKQYEKGNFWRTARTVSKRIFRFIWEPRNDNLVPRAFPSKKKKPCDEVAEMTEKYEYCITVPRTFVYESHLH